MLILDDDKVGSGCGSPQSKLVLLGDRDQLASVEAGSAGRPCLHGDVNRSTAWATGQESLERWFTHPKQRPNIASAVSNLGYSFRTDVPEIVSFPEQSGKMTWTATKKSTSFERPFHGA